MHRPQTTEGKGSLLIFGLIFCTVFLGSFARQAWAGAQSAERRSTLNAADEVGRGLARASEARLDARTHCPRIIRDRIASDHDDSLSFFGAGRIDAPAKACANIAGDRWPFKTAKSFETFLSSSTATRVTGDTAWLVDRQQCFLGESNENGRSSETDRMAAIGAYYSYQNQIRLGERLALARVAQIDWLVDREPLRQKGDPCGDSLISVTADACHRLQECHPKHKLGTPGGPFGALQAELTGAVQRILAIKAAKQRHRSKMDSDSGWAAVKQKRIDAIKAAYPFAILSGEKFWDIIDKQGPGAIGAAIRLQLLENRKQETQRFDRFKLASQCLTSAQGKGCTDFDATLAEAPSFAISFEHVVDLKLHDPLVSKDERTKFLQTAGLFETASCRQKLREIRDGQNQEFRDLYRDVAFTVATAGLGAGAEGVAALVKAGKIAQGASNIARGLAASEDLINAVQAVSAVKEAATSITACAQELPKLEGGGEVEATAAYLVPLTCPSQIQAEIGPNSSSGRYRACVATALGQGILNVLPTAGTLAKKGVKALQKGAQATEKLTEKLTEESVASRALAEAEDSAKPKAPDVKASAIAKTLELQGERDLASLAFLKSEKFAQSKEILKGDGRIHESVSNVFEPIKAQDKDAFIEVFTSRKSPPGGRPNLAGDHFAVNKRGNGEPVSVEGFVRGPDGKYKPVYSIYENGKLVPQATSHHKPLDEACILCHAHPVTGELSPVPWRSLSGKKYRVEYQAAEAKALAELGPDATKASILEAKKGVRKQFAPPQTHEAKLAQFNELKTWSRKHLEHEGYQDPFLEDFLEQ